MPHINVITDTPSHARVYSERVTVTDFETEHFRAQLIERLAWAVGDADTAERAHENGDSRAALAFRFQSGDRRAPRVTGSQRAARAAGGAARARQAAARNKPPRRQERTGVGPPQHSV
jgi:hypothetical protein